MAGTEKLSTKEILGTDVEIDNKGSGDCCIS
jgi:hypothetical protein